MSFRKRYQQYRSYGHTQWNALILATSSVTLTLLAIAIGVLLGLLLVR